MPRSLSISPGPLFGTSRSLRLHGLVGVFVIAAVGGCGLARTIDSDLGELVQAAGTTFRHSPESVRECIASTLIGSGSALYPHLDLVAEGIVVKRETVAADTASISFAYGSKGERIGIARFTRHEDRWRLTELRLDLDLLD